MKDIVKAPFYACSAELKDAEEAARQERAEQNRARRAETPAVEGDIIIVGGIEKRLTTLGSLQQRYAILQARALPTVYIYRPDFLPIQDVDLHRRLAGEVVFVGADEDGNPYYLSAAKVWTENAHRHVYCRVVFSAVAVAEDSYNLYRGLGVEPREGPCELIVAHIKSVLCDNDLIAGEAMLDLMAWQLQHIGEPSRVIVMLHNPNQQAGKGIILEETLLSIYGPSGFSPSSIDQLLGRFNDSIRGRAYLFCDEVLFAGDLRSANALKALSTTTKKGIETKNLPVVECPLGVNLWLASNNENPIHIEEG